MPREQERSRLDEVRGEIDAVDRAMAELFARRMAAVAQIAAYKARHGLPVFDPAREAAVLERNGALVDEEIRPYYLRFLEDMMAESRAYQRRLLGGATAEAEDKAPQAG